MRGLLVVDRHLRALENGDAAALEHLLADDFVYVHSVHPKPLDKQTYIRMVLALYRAMPDWHFEEKALEEDGERVHGTLRITGTQTGMLDLSFLGDPPVPARGRPVTLPEQFVRWTLDDDRIASIEMVSRDGAHPILEALGLGPGRRPLTATNAGISA